MTGPLGEAFSPGHVPEDPRSQSASRSHRGPKIRHHHTHQPGRLVDFGNGPANLSDAGKRLTVVNGNVAARSSALHLPAEKICVESPGSSSVFSQKTEPAYRTWPIGGCLLLS